MLKILGVIFIILMFTNKKDSPQQMKSAVSKTISSLKREFIILEKKVEYPMCLEKNTVTNSNGKIIQLHITESSQLM